MSDSDGLLTVRQLRDLLQVDRVTIYRMLQDGRLQGFKVGGQWRFSRQAIEQWLQEQRAPAPAPFADGGTPATDALPLSCIAAIQDVFAQALGVGAVTIAPDGSPLTSCANCPEFCDLVLHSPAGRERCAGSWKASMAEPRRTPRLTTCHAGLHYVWDWVVVQGVPLAAALVGQYRDRPAAGGASAAGIEELAAACGLAVQQLLDAWQRVPVLDEARQQQLTRLLRRMVASFTEIGEERLCLLGRLHSIAKMTQL